MIINARRVSSNNIQQLLYNEIFVFGSNLAGRHGRGAAKDALKFGAVYGKFFGLYGNTYAIPTVNSSITDKLHLKDIKVYVDDFINYAKWQGDLTFLVTSIGCGLAGWTVEDIAPLFKEAIDIQNIYLPESFWQVLEKL